jgi:hypothetical protein
MRQEKKNSLNLLIFGVPNITFRTRLHKFISQIPQTSIELVVWGHLLERRSLVECGRLFTDIDGREE